MGGKTGVALLDIGREEGAVLWLAASGSCLEKYFSFLEIEGGGVEPLPLGAFMSEFPSISLPSAHALHISCLLPYSCKFRIGPWSRVGEESEV